MELKMKLIIFIVVLSSLVSLYNVEATDPNVDIVCSQTRFPDECITSVTKYASGSVDGHSALQAGLQDLTDQTQNAIAKVQKMNEEAKDGETKKAISATLARLQTLVDSTKKVTEAIPSHGYVKLKKELEVQVDVVGTGDRKGNSLLNDQAYILNKVALNNLDILVNVLKPDLPKDNKESKKEEGQKVEVENEKGNIPEDEKGEKDGNKKDLDQEKTEENKNEEENNTNKKEDKNKLEDKKEDEQKDANKKEEKLISEGKEDMNDKNNDDNEDGEDMDDKNNEDDEDYDDKEEEDDEDD